MSKTQTTTISAGRYFDVELLDVLELADLLDEKASTVREWLESDPDRLPVPLRFGAMLRWPRQQVSAWYLADCPRSFEHGPEAFCPRAVWQVSDNYPGGSLE